MPRLIKHSPGSIEVRFIRPEEKGRLILQRFPEAIFTDGDDYVLGFFEPKGIQWTGQISSVDGKLESLRIFLQPHRKFFRQLESDGVEIILRIFVNGRVFKIEPESLLVPHQLHLKTEIHFVP